jgi:iron(III) transport system permease protein
VRAYGPGGLTDDLLGLHLPGLYGPVGVVLVIAVNAMPFAYLLAVAALNTVLRPEYEVAARASGGRPATVARTVTLPLLAPALLGAAALVFVVGINAFGIPVILGTPASFETVTTRIYQDLARSAVPEAFSRAVLLAAGLVVLALVFVLVAEALLSRLGEVRRSGAPSGLAVRRLRPSRALTAMAWAAIVVVTIFPFVALVLVALTRGVGLSPAPGNLTLGNFREALEGGLLGALGRSLSLAVVAATLCLLLGAAVAALQRRRLGRIAGLAGILAFAVPGSTLAVAMLLSYGNAMRDTLLLILVAYVAKLWAVSHRSIAGSASGLSPEATRAARSSGASGMTAVRTVVVPPLRPALIAGWLLVFLVAFHELTMSSLLYGPGTETVAVAVLNLQQLGDVPVSSALAVILTLPPLLAAAPILALGRLPRRFLATG